MKKIMFNDRYGLTQAVLSGNMIENSEGKTLMQVVAEVSIYYADAVIAKLKEEQS